MNLIRINYIKGKNLIIHAIHTNSSFKIMETILYKFHFLLGPIRNVVVFCHSFIQNILNIKVH